MQKDDATVVSRATHVIKCFVRGPHYGASLERLRIRISEFRALIDDALKLAPARGVSLHTLQKLVLVQKCASWLHDALKDGWKCTCEDPHPANIQLDVWAPLDAVDHKADQVCFCFSLLFAEDARQAQYDHWMTAEIRTSRSDLEQGRPMVVGSISSTQVGSPSAQSVTRYVRGL